MSLSRCMVKRGWGGPPERRAEEEEAGKGGEDDDTVEEEEETVAVEGEVVEGEDKLAIDFFLDSLEVVLV